MKKILLSILFVALNSLAFAQPKVVAHRGYWRAEGSAQNSITSLQKADEIGCYGSELDVWITPEGVPVVFHDSKLNGKKVEDTPFTSLMNYQLANGEFLPTLQQYLQEAKKHPQCQLILEIKPHSTAERDEKAVKITLELVHLLGMQKQVEYISFSKHACECLCKQEPTAKVAYLSGDLTPAEAQKQLGVNGIDYQNTVFEKHPEWIAEAQKCGLEVNVWTVDGEEALRHYANLKGIDIITTNDPNILIDIIKK